MCTKQCQLAGEAMCVVLQVNNVIVPLEGECGGALGSIFVIFVTFVVQ